MLRVVSLSSLLFATANADAGVTPTGQVEVHSTSFSGDIDPKTRSISGTITVQPGGEDADTLQGYLLYPTADGSANLAAELPTHAMNLAKSCPVDSNNEDNDHVLAGNAWATLAAAECNNKSPYSPKCDGATCDKVLIKAGSDGEFYITRYDNTANQQIPDSFSNPYASGEAASIYLPNDGTLVLVSKDVGDDATLTLDDNPDGAGTSNLHNLTPGVAVPLTGRESMVNWATTGTGGSGWTLVFTPNYPTLTVTNEYMTDGSGGFRVVPVTGAAGAAAVTTTLDASLAEYDAGANFVETYDWVVPNSTCTPTTIHCAIPNTWAHIDYSTPATTPEPAEGQCAQQKSGTTNALAGGCSVNALPNSGAAHAQGTGTGQTGPFNGRWAGNCGDAASYFWFEKIACGSVRYFHTDRSLIEDHVQLSPSEVHIQQIKDLYYTTKAPEARADFGGGVRFARPDYHIAPLLPPKVNCSCFAAMDAYASLLSVVSKTVTPDAPETLDPEVLNSGTSKIVATLRVYNDPTYSIPADSSSAVPVVVQRFYLEVSTKFTRNHITISDCTAAHTEPLLNDTNALKPRAAYCDSVTYDTQSEGVPAGITHMDRISMKKFKFGVTTDVFMQCKIRACSSKPCGSCAGRQLEENTSSRSLQMAMEPMEGEMFAPAAQIKIGQFDKNIMVVPTITPTAPIAQPVVQNSPTSKPLQIKSDISLPLTPQWAIENRESLINTLRATLALRADEDLVITKISAARRLEESNNRELQAGGSVKVDFIVGLTQPARANQAQSSLTALSTGNANVVRTFTQQLDAQLQSAGKAPVALPPTAVRVAIPQQVTVSQPAALGSAQPASFSWTPTTQYVQPQAQYGQYNAGYGQMQMAQYPQSAATPVAEEKGSNSSLLIILACGAAGLLLLFCVFGKCGVHVHSDEHGSHISFGSRPAPAAAPAGQPVATGTYQGKVNPAEFDNMFAEPQ